MHDTTHTLTVLGASLRMAALAFNQRRQAEIMLSRTRSIYLTEIASDVLEVSFPIPGLPDPDRALLQAMLTTNRHDTAPGRLALDPVTKAASYGERWLVRTMSAEDVEAAFGRIAATSKAWHSGEAEALTARADELRRRASASLDAMVTVFADAEAEVGLDEEDADETAVRVEEPDLPFFVRL